MQPLITNGAFAVSVAGTQTGRLLATSERQLWYLGSQWASGSPDTIELTRTTNLTGNPDKWLERAHAALKPLGRGEICALSRSFPNYLRTSQASMDFGILDDSPGLATAWMQLDPGVVTVWSPGFHGDKPDIGYGCIEIRANGSRIESWVALKGVTPKTRVRIERAWRGSNRLKTQARFRALTKDVALDYDSAMRSVPTEYSSYIAFRQAI